MKKKISLVLVVILVVVSFTAGVLAAANVTKVTAYLNKSLAIKVDGEIIEPTETDGTRIYPLVYNGRTFVPARAIAEALGAEVDYDPSGNATVIINSAGSDLGKPVNEGKPLSTTDTTGNDTKSSSGTTPAAGNSGTASETYDKNLRSTWLKFSNFKFAPLEGAKNSTYYEVTFDVKNITSEPVEFKAYADLYIYDKDGDSVSSVITGSGNSSGTLASGETKRFGKAFSIDSLDYLGRIEFYPMYFPSNRADRVDLDYKN